MGLANWLKEKAGIEVFTGGQPLFDSVGRMGYEPTQQGFNQYLTDKQDFEDRGITPTHEMFVQLNERRKLE